MVPSEYLNLKTPNQKCPSPKTFWELWWFERESPRRRHVWNICSPADGTAGEAWPWWMRFITLYHQIVGAGKSSCSPQCSFCLSLQFNTWTLSCCCSPLPPPTPQAIISGKYVHESHIHVPIDTWTPYTFTHTSKPENRARWDSVNRRAILCF